MSIGKARNEWPSHTSCILVFVLVFIFILVYLGFDIEETVDSRTFVPMLIRQFRPAIWVECVLDVP